MSLKSEFEAALRSRLPVVARCAGCGADYVSYPTVTAPCSFCGGRVIFVSRGDGDAWADHFTGDATGGSGGGEAEEPQQSTVVMLDRAAARSQVYEMTETLDDETRDLLRLKGQLD